MRRSAFLGGALAATLAPAAACAQPSIAVADLCAQIPGVTGLVARTMDGAPPIAQLHAHEQFPSASVIKLAIMATVYRAYDAGTTSPEQMIRTRASDLIGGSDVLAGSPPGKAWSIDELVKAMIHVSDNSASNTLITAFGMGTINATMRHAGMTNSRLARHFADVVPAWEVSKNVVTPADVATLLYTIERGAREGIPTIASPRSCRAMVDVLLGNDDGSKIVRGLPAGTPCAHKTGEIDGVRNDAGIIDPFGDLPYILVVLTKELDDTSAGNAGIAAIAHRVDADLRRAG
ncbi:MAG TPA: serine hydrolase [Candidatus Limnocylindria bacterium]|jgi:beta-lactamase class A|nr:serine hydrolase [Candidatus Limnocylindria bacterium]